MAKTESFFSYLFLKNSIEIQDQDIFLEIHIDIASFI